MCVKVKKKNPKQADKKTLQLQDLFALHFPSIWGLGKVGGKLTSKNLVEIFEELGRSCVIFPFVSSSD